MRAWSRRALTLFASVISLTAHLAAQPAITSWKLNTTGETGTYTLQNGTKGTLPANVQLVQYDATYVYVSASGIPSYDIGPFPWNPNVPANQHYVAAIPRTPVLPATKAATQHRANSVYLHDVGTLIPYY